MAAKTQADAAKSAAELQHEDAQAALGFQQQEWQTQQQNLAPWLQTGQQSLGKLSELLGLGGDKNAADYGQLAKGWQGQFQAPTAEQARQTPGYQFTLGQGEQAIQNSAAARGGLLSGNTAQSLEQFGQGLADTTYQQTYNNAFNQYLQGYNEFQQNQANLFNRYGGVAGVGQQAATTLGQQGQAAAGNVSNINLTSGGQIGQSLQNAGAATASGYAGIANALGGGVNNISQYLMLQGLLGNQGGSSPNLPPVNDFLPPGGIGF